MEGRTNSSYGYTALKEDCVEFVEWQGVAHYYPKWFTDFLPAALMQETLPTGKGRLAKKDIFVLNGDGTVQYYERTMFNRLYNIIYQRNYINLCALKRDTLLYRYMSDDVTQPDGSEGVEMYVEFLNKEMRKMTMSMYDFVEMFASYGIY